MTETQPINNIFSPQRDELVLPVKKQPKPRFFLPWLWLVKRIVVGPDQLVRLSDEETARQRRRVALSVAQILLVLLVISLGLGTWQRRRVAQASGIAVTQSRVEFAINQAAALGKFQPARAVELLQAESDNIDLQLRSIRSKAAAAKLADLKQQLQLTLAQSGRVVKLEPEIFLTLNLIREQTVGQQLSLWGEQLFVLDPGNGVLLAISAVNRSGEVAGGGEALTSAIRVAGSGRKVYILTKDQLVEINLDTRQSAAVVEAQGEWQEAIDIGAFSSSLYVLDRGASDIFKYPATDDGFGQRRRWLAPGFAPDLSTAVDMDIDGDVWVLHQDGRISKFRHGAAAGFRLKPVDQLVEPVAVSVPIDGSRLWILDRGGQRAIAFDRESGEYQGQWVAEAFGEATDVAVNEKLGKMFVLAGEKIYSIEIKN